MTTPSLFISPAAAFISGVPTFGEFSQWVQNTPGLDPQIPAGLGDLQTTLASFTALVGSQYADRYGLEAARTALKTTGRGGLKEDVSLLKGGLAALAGHLKDMSADSPLVYGAALTLLQDEAVMDGEGGLRFVRFPRISAARVPGNLPPGVHEVEDATNPGERLVTFIPRNLKPEDYREALGIASPRDAAAIFTDPSQIPARRILALKYWHFSLDGDVDMRRTTAKALLKTVIEESWGDFQEFAVRIVSNLLAGEYNLWMGFYLRELWHYLSEVDPQHLTPLQEETVLVLITQFGSVLYRHADDLKGQPSQLDYKGAVSGLLRFFDPSRNFPRKIREEAFYLWAFIVEDFYRGGREEVHERLKKAAAEEKDIDLLYAILDNHIWQGNPLPTVMVQEILGIVLKRPDLDEEQRISFRQLLQQGKEPIPPDASEDASAQKSFWGLWALADRFFRELGF